MPANNGKIIGIDLGTTNSVLGVIQGGAPLAVGGRHLAAE